MIRAGRGSPSSRSADAATGPPMANSCAREWPSDVDEAVITASANIDGFIVGEGRSSVDGIEGEEEDEARKEREVLRVGLHQKAHFVRNSVLETQVRLGP